jgi:uncharacterized membrane protein HdeD (DUF308 family)
MDLSPVAEKEGNMASEEKQDWREERQEGRRRHRGPFLIPAGVLIGLGIGLLFNQAGAGVLIGLGLGFLGSALIPSPPPDEPSPSSMHGPRWLPVLIGAFLILVGLSIVAGVSLPWTSIIAIILILIGLWFVSRGFGWMR